MNLSDKFLAFSAIFIGTMVIVGFVAMCRDDLYGKNDTIQKSLWYSCVGLLIFSFLSLSTGVVIR